MKFTAKQDQIIINAIKAKPYNLQQAFRDAAREIGMVFPEGIQRRYYTKIRYEHQLFSIKSDLFYGSNIKSFTVATKRIKITNNLKFGMQYVIPFK